MATYNKERYLKFKEEHPEKIAENSKKSYNKLKTENPEKLKEYRKAAYLRYKEKNAEKLRERRNESSKKFYEKNKEKIIASMMEKYYAKKALAQSNTLGNEFSGTISVSTDKVTEKSESVSISKNI